MPQDELTLFGFVRQSTTQKRAFRAAYATYGAILAIMFAGVFVGAGVKFFIVFFI